LEYINNFPASLTFSPNRNVFCCAKTFTKNTLTQFCKQSRALPASPQAPKRLTLLKSFVENIKPHDVRIIAEGEKKNLDNFVEQIKIKFSDDEAWLEEQRR
jgi:hypothetical protein